MQRSILSVGNKETIVRRCEFEEHIITYFIYSVKLNKTYSLGYASTIIVKTSSTPPQNYYLNSVPPSSHEYPFDPFSPSCMEVDNAYYEADPDDRIEDML